MDILAEFKEKGNEAYKKGIVFKQHTAGKQYFIEACTAYYECLKILRPGPTEEVVLGLTKEEKNKWLITIYMNLAAGGLALDSFDSAERCCADCLLLDPGNCKALLRRGIFLLSLYLISRLGTQGPTSV